MPFSIEDKPTYQHAQGDEHCVEHQVGILCRHRYSPSFRRRSIPIPRPSEETSKPSTTTRNSGVRGCPRTRDVQRQFDASRAKTPRHQGRSTGVGGVEHPRWIPLPFSRRFSNFSSRQDEDAHLNARALLRMLAAMTAPCSVNVYGGYFRCVPRFKITDCDLKRRSPVTVSTERRNAKSGGVILASDSAMLPEQWLG